MSKSRARVFVCSALRGDQQNNESLAETYCRYVTDCGKAPYAPHLLMTRFLDDDIEEERMAGIESGVSFLFACDELWAFSVKGVVSSGMNAEVELAVAEGIKVRWFSVARNGALEELRHLEDSVHPTKYELMLPDDYAGDVASVFQRMESAIKAGDFAEDFAEELDGVLGTTLPKRNREAEEAFEMSRRVDND